MSVMKRSYTESESGTHIALPLRRWSTLVFVGSMLALSLGACSSDPEDNTVGNGSANGNGSASGGSGTSTGASPGAGGSGTSGHTDGGTTSSGSTASVIVLPTGSGGSADTSTGGTCAASTQETDITPIDMYIMFDRSSSMNNESVPTLWEEATAALTGFLQAPGSANFGVALRFFPDNDPAPGCIGDVTFGGFGTGGAAAGAGGAASTELTCDVASCQMPLVAVGNLIEETGAADPQETLLVEAIANKEVLTESQGTPTFAALSGALDWGKARLTAVPDRKPIVVLVTDGQPSGCGDVTQIVTLAEGGLDAGVSTYVIGLEGSSDFTIQQIATAGGTKGIFIGGADSNAGEDLIAALDAIRGEALLCQFPTPLDEGILADPDKVNVRITLTDEAVTEVFKTTGETTCIDGSGMNWFYEDAESTTIALCPSACELVKSDVNARIDVELGCPTAVIH